MVPVVLMVPTFTPVFNNGRLFLSVCLCASHYKPVLFYTISWRKLNLTLLRPVQNFCSILTRLEVSM